MLEYWAPAVWSYRFVGEIVDIPVTALTFRSAFGNSDHFEVSACSFDTILERRSQSWGKKVIVVRPRATRGRLGR